LELVEKTMGTWTRILGGAHHKTIKAAEANMQPLLMGCEVMLEKTEGYGKVCLNLIHSNGMRCIVLEKK